MGDVFVSGMKTIFAPGAAAAEQQSKQMKEWAEEQKKEVEEAQRVKNMEAGQTTIYTPGVSEEATDQGRIVGVANPLEQASGGPLNQQSVASQTIADGVANGSIEVNPLRNAIDLTGGKMAANAFAPLEFQHRAELDDNPKSKYGFAPNPGPLLGDSFEATPASWKKKLMR